ncbi:MAG: TonB-dependent receptor [Bryobacteraceae bacterium]
MRKTIWLALCLGALPLVSQEFRATITGRVTDASGSAVPGAAVAVRNIDTNESAATATDGGGSYTVPFLKPGNYTLTVESTGFKKVSREGLTLNVGQTASVNIVLEIGAVSDQITVTGETPLLEVAKADRGTVIDNRRVTELPLNARNPFMLSQLVAGVNYNGNAIYQRPFDNGAIADWSINGSRNRQNEFLLDGAPNNAQAGGNNLAYVPPVDSVQEFKIQLNSYDSQYGKTGGGVVNVTLKSGTNELHGTGYEFLRRRGLDANSFQNNSRGVERANHFLDQYGGLLSGPVMLPKIWDGRNRTFFMVNYEGYREGTPNPINASVPEPEFLNGDFSKLRTPQGQLITIYDPTTGREVNGQWVRDPFPGNVIPANRINPIAKSILSYYPKPNAASPNLDYSRGNLFISPNIASDDFYNFTVKIDQNLGQNHRFFFRHASNDRTETRTVNGIQGGPGEDGPLPLKRVNDAYVVDWVSTISPNLIFNIRPSYARYIEGSRGDGNAGFDITSLGFPKSLQDQLPVSGFFGRYEFSDYLSLGRYFNFNYTNTIALHPTFTWIKGAHNMKFGVDMRWLQYNVQDSGNVFQLNFNRGFTQSQFNRGDQLSGNAIASALLGSPSGGQVQTNVFPSWVTSYYAPYFQDDWKVTRRLTLNLGLRWDVNMPAYERHNQMTRDFNPSVVNPVNALIDRTQFPTLPELRGVIEFAGVNGLPRRAASTDWNNLQPRAGAAFQIGDKFVVRGGFGMYYLNPSNNWHRTANFSLSTPLVNTLDEGRTAVPDLINNPYPQVLTLRELRQGLPRFWAVISLCSVPASAFLARISSRSVFSTNCRSGACWTSPMSVTGHTICRVSGTNPDARSTWFPWRTARSATCLREATRSSATSAFRIRFRAWSRFVGPPRSLPQ